VAGSALLWFSKRDGRIPVGVTPGSFPNRLSIADVHAKTSLSALRVILETRVKNTAGDWDLISM